LIDIYLLSYPDANTRDMLQSSMINFVLWKDRPRFLGWTNHPLTWTVGRFAGNEDSRPHRSPYPAAGK